MRNATLRIWLPRLALAALAVAGLSCGRDVSGPGARNDTPSPLFALSASEQRALEEQLEREKQRIFEESERSKAIYDSLKLEWDKLRTDYKITSSGIVLCDPLQYAADARIVGPEGADMSIGPHKLRIPAGALTTYEVITGEMPVSLSVGVRLSPQGLTFVAPPQLTLSYKHCLLPSNHAERVAYVDEAQKILEYPTSRDRTKNGLVDAWLRHFSDYVVAW